MSEQEMPEPIFPGTYIFPPAPQIQAMYGDSRLADIQDAKDAPRYNPREERRIQPSDPPRVCESRFVYLEHYSQNPSAGISPIKELKYIEEPDGYKDGVRWGGGLGFDFIKGRHLLRGKIRPATRPPELIPEASYSFIIAAPRAVMLLEAFGVTQLETLGINWTDDTDPEFHGYVFLDVRRLIDAYDYRGCEIVFTKSRGQMLGRLGQKLSFRNDIDPSVHMFHDLYNRRPFIISRTLAHHLRDSKVGGFFIRDPANFEDAFWHEDLARGAKRVVG